ncbi:hypothetical protein K435DRAFT_968266 [Dendrothele bispora CBS 962.96]|uniref:DUF4203 domain-containing protein n=1 Tax=Dendrothele bispora (strain CBS 962.96) TaxID=1314807 RepID=A0A4S8LPM4_DENBC|nr:hypothetical protein K435DRAFT_968266 [Dendrothele bispora CBS 962.96]
MATAYALPLLFGSLALTFAGAFLTLDRSRSFALQYDAIPDSFASPSGKKKIQFIFNGGVSGLLTGYSFGLYLTPFLSLLIPKLFPSMSLLSEKSFIAIWPLPSLLTTFLGSQYKYAALAFGGVTGGIVLPSIIRPIPNLPVYLPLDSSNVTPFDWLLVLPAHPDLVISVALLAHIPVWAHVWSGNGTPTSPTTFPTSPAEQERSNTSSPSGIDGPLPHPLATLPVNKEMIFPEDPKHPIKPRKSSPPKQLSPHLPSHLYPVNAHLKIHFDPPKLTRFKSGIGSGSVFGHDDCGFVLSGDEAYDLPGKKMQGVLKSSVESEQDQGVYSEEFGEGCGRGGEEENGSGQV